MGTAFGCNSAMGVAWKTEGLKIGVLVKETCKSIGKFQWSCETKESPALVETDAGDFLATTL